MGRWMNGAGESVNGYRDIDGQVERQKGRKQLGRTN